MVPFWKLQTFSGTFWVLLNDYSLYEKAILGSFVYLFICEDTATKVNFRFYKQCSQPQHVLFANEPFLYKILVLFYCSNILLLIEKNSVSKLCKVLEMEPKMYSPVATRFIFEKINFIKVFFIIFFWFPILSFISGY